MTAIEIEKGQKKNGRTFEKTYRITKFGNNSQ
jgi:hypothetical protein